MPRGDRTGPTGAGPLSGRGMGFCKGYDVPGYMNPGFGQGFGRGRGSGRGMGRGNRWGYQATGQPGWARGYAGDFERPMAFQNQDIPYSMNEHNELRYLKDQAKSLKQMLQDINSRIDELDKKDENKEA